MFERWNRDAAFRRSQGVKQRWRFMRQRCMLKGLHRRLPSVWGIPSKAESYRRLRSQSDPQISQHWHWPDGISILKVWLPLRCFNAYSLSSNLGPTTLKLLRYSKRVMSKQYRQDRMQCSKRFNRALDNADNPRQTTQITRYFIKEAMNIEEMEQLRTRNKMEGVRKLCRTIAKLESQEFKNKVREPL